MAGRQAGPETPDEFAARMRRLVNAPLSAWRRPRRSQLSRPLFKLRDRVLHATLARGIHVEPQQVTLDHFTGARLAYEPCDVLVARRALNLIPRDCRGTVVEFGCGMGLVACLAARRDFGRVIGVDISESLTG